MTTMGRIQGTYFVELPGAGLWVDDRLLGQSLDSVYDDFNVQAVLPREDGSFPGSFDLNTDDIRALTGGRSRAPGGVPAMTSVSVLRVSVVGSFGFGSRDFEDRPTAPLQLASDSDKSMRSAALRFVGDVLARVRSDLGQYQVGTSTDAPRLVWLSSLVDLETGQPIHVGHGGTVHVVSADFDARLSTEMAADILHRVRVDAPIDMASELLADARYLAFVRTPPDLRLALLLGAIACEVKIKRSLRELVPPERRRFVELVIDNPGDVSMAVVTHLHKTAEAAIGRSLSTEDPALYQRAENLFKHRNRLAHGRSPQPSNKEMRQAVAAAVDVFRWIQSLTPSENDAE